MKKIEFFVILFILTIPLFAQVPMTDTFDGPTLNTDLWEFYDPLNNCSVSVVGGNAEISMFFEEPHNLWPGETNAPRLLQPATNVDFTIEVKFESTPESPNNYQMQGIIVQEAYGKYIRCGTYSTSSATHIFRAVIDGAQSSSVYSTQIAIPQFLRVNKLGNWWTYSYSYNGTNWVDTPQFELPTFIVTKVGFYGGNPGDAPAFTAKADYFWNLDQPLPVTLSSFTAIYANSTPILHWTTQSENSNLGWNVYRSFSQNLGQASQINNELIPGAGTTSEPTYYQFTDEYDAIVGQTYWYWLETVDGGGNTDTYGPATLTVPEEEPVPVLPQNTFLCRNYPNPFNPDTKIEFSIKEGENGTLSIYNTKGQLLETHQYKAGEHELAWDATQYGSGIYFYKLETQSYTETRRMLMLK